MTVNKYMLFYTPMCPKCPKIKEFMEDSTALDKEWVDCATKEGLAKAKEFSVMQVPTVIFFSADKEVSRASNIEEVKRVVENQQLE